MSDKPAFGCSAPGIKPPKGYPFHVGNTAGRSRPVTSLLFSWPRLRGEGWPHSKQEEGEKGGDATCTGPSGGKAREEPLQPHVGRGHVAALGARHPDWGPGPELNPICKWAKDLNKYFAKQSIQIVNKHIKATLCQYHFRRCRLKSQ